MGAQGDRIADAILFQLDSAAVADTICACFKREESVVHRQVRIRHVAHARAKSGFSLVELSIVLVILGLLTGGILAGQSLIRAAELRAVSTEFSKFSTAYQIFRDKYFAIPGDMNNATAFWGVAAGTGSDAACKAFVSTSAVTCNGDGNGQIGSSIGSLEYFRQWQHLANAGLIEGQYDGQLGTPQYGPTAEPASKLPGGTWYGIYSGNPSASVSRFGGDYGNMLEFSSIVAPFVLMKPEEAWNIDTKFDDGLPGTGRVFGYKGTTTNPCTSNANNISDVGAVYNLSNSNKICYIDFLKVI